MDWVLVHGDRWDQYWARTSEPTLLFGVALLVLPRKTAALAGIAVMRAILAQGDPRFVAETQIAEPLRVLERLEQWAWTVGDDPPGPDITAQASRAASAEYDHVFTGEAAYAINQLAIAMRIDESFSRLRKVERMCGALLEPLLEAREHRVPLRKHDFAVLMRTHLPVITLPMLVGAT